MAQTRDHLGLSGTLGVRLTPTVHPLHHAVGGLGFATAAYLVSPAIVPAGRTGSMAATGLIPGGTEVIIFLNRIKVISLGNLEMIGASIATGVGAWNAYRLRNEISAFARDKYGWIIDKANWTPTIEFGDIRVKPGDGPSSLSQRTSRSPRFGKRRRRCKHRNKAGKQCLRPAGHSGRHRYR